MVKEEPKPGSFHSYRHSDTSIVGNPGKLWWAIPATKQDTMRLHATKVGGPQNLKDGREKVV